MGSKGRCRFLILWFLILAAGCARQGLREIMPYAGDPTLGEISYPEANTLKLGYSLKPKPSLDLTSAFNRPILEENRTALSRRGHWMAQVKTDATGALPEIDADLAFGFFDAETGDGFGEDEHGLMRIAASHSLAGNSFSASYYRVGAKYDAPEYFLKDTKSKKKKDREGYEVWFSRWFGNFGLRPYVRLGQDNLSGDPATATETSTSVGLTIDYILSNWPYWIASLSYGQGSVDSSGGEKESSSEATTFATASLSFSGDHYSGDLSAERSTGGNDDGRTLIQPTTTSLYAQGYYYPASGLTVGGGVGYGVSDYLGGGMLRYLSPYFSLSYEAVGLPYSVNLYGQYDRQFQPAWELDTKAFYGAASLDWLVSKSRRNPNGVSLMLTFDRYQDAFSRSGDVAVWLTFTAFEGLPFLSRTGHFESWRMFRRLWDDYP